MDKENIVIIDGIKIHIKNGIKYKKYGSNGEMKKLCSVDNCIKEMQVEKYCLKHFSELCNDKNTNDKLKLDKLNKITAKYNDIKVTQINNVMVYIINNNKYKINEVGKLRMVCKFDGCDKYARKTNNSFYCCTHKNGTDPNSTERICEKENNMNNKKIKLKQCTKIGNNTEMWLCDLMNIFGNVNSIERIGYTGNILDIIYKNNNENNYRGIQVKTLIEDLRYDNKYSINLRKKKYKKNTLIVGINKTRNKFTLFFAGQIKSGCPTFSFNNYHAIYKKFMFTSLLKFMCTLEKLLFKSSLYDINDVSKETKQESESLERLKQKCINLNIAFNRHTNNHSAIDCFINNYNIQCKTSKVHDSANYYKFNIQKNCGKVNGKRNFQPYSDKDNIDFFIFEIIDFPNYFYVIPIKELINKGIISSNNNIGKVFITLAMHVSDINHWSRKYINNFEPLMKNEFHDLIYCGI